MNISMNTIINYRELIFENVFSLNNELKKLKIITVKILL